MTAAHRSHSLSRALLAFAVVAGLSAATRPAAATPVLFQTVVGDFIVDLFDATAPATVANFLNYVTDGDYDDTIVHRSVPNFVIQGGGFDTLGLSIPTDGPIGVAEIGASNLRGTIAMAHAGSAAAATNQWFINIVDNPFLDPDFAVFGEVRPGGMAVVDAINALPLINAGGPFIELPVLDGGGTTDPSNLVVVTSVTVIPEPTSLATLGALALAAGATARRVRR